jgi:hypothetical protein
MTLEGGVEVTEETDGGKTELANQEYEGSLYWFNRNCAMMQKAQKTVVTWTPDCRNLASSG